MKEKIIKTNIITVNEHLNTKDKYTCFVTWVNTRWLKVLFK